MVIWTIIITSQNCLDEVCDMICVIALIISCRFLCNECAWSGGLRDHMISDRLLPLGHDRHGHTHWFLPTVGYFVESHDPRGWGYYRNLDEVMQSNCC